MLKVIYKKDSAYAERIEGSLLKILAYFSVFDFPLSADEIRKYLPPGSNEDCVETALTRLAEEGSIFKFNDVYSLQNKIELVKRKQQGYLRAEQLLPKAMRIGRFLCAFPYVRGIGVSGGLSKMYAHENADIDFFIITKANRLWIARTIMHLYKKFTFLTGKQHYHCMNYFLDEKALRLKDQNIYTAFETITLIPVCGEAIHDFFVANGWVSEWFANYPETIKAQQKPSPKSWIKRMIERIFNNKMGDRLDNYLMKLTTRRWKKKEEQRMLNYEGKEMSLLTGKHFAWSNPDSFQQKIVGLYNKKMTAIKNEWPEYFKPFNYSFEE
ncbi:MAG TPA: hypothetical protein VI461_03555 [Chitinophagaceae bacterium]|nr:hypothetical protein [Chitinophagaceae bacterium]